MKKILVPTDFSENANNALRYAINIANYFEAEVTLVHIYSGKIPSQKHKKLDEYVKEDAERQLADCIRDFKGNLANGTILKGKTIKGLVVQSISSIATYEKMDLIVMGTTGASGLKGIFWGTNTSEVMKNCLTPILAVPSGFKFRAIKNIVFPVDSAKITDREVLSTLRSIAKAYRSKVQVLHVAPEKVAVGPDDGIEYLLEEINPIYKNIAGINNINKIINTYVKEDHADLLCMIRRSRGLWANTFHKSITKKEIFDSPVPLLILHSTEVN